MLLVWHELGIGNLVRQGFVITQMLQLYPPVSLPANIFHVPLQDKVSRLQVKYLVSLDSTFLMLLNLGFLGMLNIIKNLLSMDLLAGDGHTVNICIPEGSPQSPHQDLKSQAHGLPQAAWMTPCLDFYKT